MHTFSWWLLIVFAFAVNLGSWSYSYVALKYLSSINFFKNASPYTFDTFWDLTSGYFIACFLFKWGW